MTGTDLEVVVVCHNSSAQLRGLLDALWRGAPDNHAPRVLTLVDSGSTDDDLSDFDARRVIRLPNVGYGSAANVGVASTSSDWVALLNPDCRVSYDGLVELAAVGEAQDAALVGPELVDESGRPQARLTRLPGRPWKAERVDRFVPGASDIREVAALCGALLLLRRDAFVRLGGFDPGYFLYAEELDLAARLRAAGERVLWVGSQRAVHLGGASSGPTVSASWRRAQSIRSHLRFVRKHYGQVAALASAVVAVARLVVSAPRSLPRMIVEMSRNPRRGLRWPASWSDAERLAASDGEPGRRLDA